MCWIDSIWYEQGDYWRRATGCQILTDWLFELLHHYLAVVRTLAMRHARAIGPQNRDTNVRFCIRPTPAADYSCASHAQCSARRYLNACSPLIPKLSASTFHSRFDALPHRRDRLQGLLLPKTHGVLQSRPLNQIPYLTSVTFDSIMALYFVRGTVDNVQFNTLLFSSF